MWIVRLALRRPYTFAVLALLLMVLGPLAIMNMPVDIFPNINIPVVSTIWRYQGFSAEQMAERIVTLSERSLTTTVNDIEHIESVSLPNTAIVKIYFQPGVNIANAVAQVTAIAQTQIRQMPEGTTPPLVIQYNASSVPIIQLGVSGEGLSEMQLNDLALNFIRTQLVTVPGAGLPYPYGGKERQVQVDLNLPALQAKGLSPADVVNTIAAQNLILPSGTMKIGPFEYNLDTNSAPQTIEELNNLPIRQVNGAMVYIHDVAHVRNGYPPQTNIVRVNGQRATLLSVIKTGNTSTLSIVKGILSKAESLKSQLPAQLKITPLADQSLFVRASIEGVVHEGVIAACLTALMILVFLGSWRSTVIIAVSIPLSILTSLLVLSALGETINIMTLGGLALAVGILVDDATVAIENISRNLEHGKALEQAILDGSAQIAVPAFVATIAICIVFVPMFFLSGVAKYLFVPLAEAVVFAMLASYLLSRTLVPTMAKYLLREHHASDADQPRRSRNPFVRSQQAFEYRFERIRTGYRRMLDLCIRHAGVFMIIFFVFTVGSAAFLYPFLGADFFPSVDAGQFKLHVRARTGTRIEDMADLCDRIDNTIREMIPQKELGTIIDNIGLPYSGINTSYSNSAAVGPADADIQVSLAPNHRPTDEYIAKLREELPQRFPGTEFYTLPVDMVTQILNFGLPSPIDVQIVGPNQAGNRAFAEKLLNDLKYVPGTADMRIQQPFNDPKLQININRTMAEGAGFQQRDIMQSLLVATSGSFQTAPTYFLDPRNGVEYSIATQAPQYALDNLQDLRNIPVTPGSGAAANRTSMGAGMPAQSGPVGGRPVQILGNLIAIEPGEEQATVTHYNITPVIDIFGNVAGSDLASVSREIDRRIARWKGQLPRGSRIVVRGQVQTMRTSFAGLLGGLIFSILLVYLLIVVNFQSWLDPFIIITALPAAVSGIIWILFVTQTRLSVPALTGAIMCMGVATSNSILVVSFAREQLEETVGDAPLSALNAGYVRFRPVLMTALAMIIGMVPMSLGLGSGGEQNAPLGRAVIGGLLFATVSTLFFVPTVFSVLHGRLERRRREREARRHSHRPQPVAGD
ncbi:MAG TPA: efflux RND transporter permease subunit [Acidobacteriaceae bacterium]|nr:efflux RND transporter permease subunit [Acidobacteriaceae bacterium]